jgi:exopolysaccharide production protein ExoQ
MIIILGLLFVVWVLARDARSRKGCSPVVWISVLWIIVGGSRPVSTWFNSGGDASSDSYDSGNPFERNIYLILIVCAVWALCKRGLRLGPFFQRNKGLMLLTLFWGASVIWADSPLIALKRWVKDTGTILITVILLSDLEPVQALRGAFVRAAYVLIPFSVLLIRYFSQLGRSYEHWGGELMNIGVTTHKSSLGVLSLTATLMLGWDLLSKFNTGSRRLLDIAASAEGLVFIMSIYLLKISASATSQVCALLAIAVFSILKFPFVQSKINFLGALILGGSLLVLALNSLFDLKSAFLNALGKDPTLTTRTEVWPVLISFQQSPILGPGFKSFWSGDRLQVLLDKYSIIQAHNGYLETYLNGGFCGVALLLLFLIAGWGKIKKDLLTGSEFARVRFAIWVVALFHNYTEASFNTFSLIWMLLLAVSIDCGDKPISRASKHPADLAASFATPS